MMEQEDPQGRMQDLWKGGANSIIERCRRRRIEVRSGDQSARSAEKFFAFIFSVVRMGSRCTFVLCTASSRCTSSNTSSRMDVVERTPREARKIFSTVIFQPSRWALVAPSSFCTALAAFWFTCHPWTSYPRREKVNVTSHESPINVKSDEDSPCTWSELRTVFVPSTSRLCIRFILTVTSSFRWKTSSTELPYNFFVADSTVSLVLV